MKQFEVPCFVDVEKTAQSLHAHAVPEGVDIRPGDCVKVHGAPSEIAYGERVSVMCSATISRANVFKRSWVYLTAPFEMLELFEVGFQPKESA